MTSRKAIFAVAGLATLAFSASAQAQPAARSEADVAAREKATNCSLLQALLKRRAEVAESATHSAERSAALDLLDRRIAEVRRRLGE